MTSPLPPASRHEWWHFPRTKQSPIRKSLQTTPFRKIVYKNTPMGQFASSNTSETGFSFAV